MTTTTTAKPKMKGIFKGFKYISQIFDEDNKQDEIQIGFPTDVKHVAHIGWDGPTIDSPSWMKEFDSSTGFQSAPLGPPTGGDPKPEPEIKWVSEDSNARRISKADPESQGRDLPDVPKSTRRHSSTNDNSSPRKKDPSNRPRRRNHSKDASEGGSVRSSKSSSQELNQGCDSPSRVPADPAKRSSRRKKSRELSAGGAEGSTRSRSKHPTTCAEAEAQAQGQADTDKESLVNNIPEPQMDPIPSA